MILSGLQVAASLVPSSGSAPAGAQRGSGVSALPFTRMSSAGTNCAGGPEDAAQKGVKSRAAGVAAIL
jgi:hypothetical protein